MRGMISKIRSFFLDTFFPVRCIGCYKEGFWICQQCLNKIHINTEHICAVCQRNIVPDGKVCLPCKRNSPLEGLIAASNYADPLISKSIHYFKYRFIKDLHKPLAEIMIKSTSKTELQIPDIIIPVPLHSRRLRWRGFNQSLLLSQEISKNLLPFSEIPIIEDALFRKRYTRPQMGISRRKERQANISDAFEIRSPESIHGKNILLIDDVSTSGSTIFECARVLKAKGAKEVYAVVVAKQENR